MGVRADNGSRLAVEIEAHGELLGGGFGVDINYLYPAVAYIFHERVDAGERIVRAVYICAPEQVYNADADSAHVYNTEALAGAGCADIRRADYIAALVEKMIYLAAPKSVVAGRYKINAA